ncbi:hypothetical protein HanIR_Chr06g0261731 [Helianthus annuus]|nr:hypothetical protein HanIR_Chr06g0261731 [Helianthus annuus]
MIYSHKTGKLLILIFLNLDKMFYYFIDLPARLWVKNMRQTDIFRKCNSSSRWSNNCSNSVGC